MCTEGGRHSNGRARTSLVAVGVVVLAVGTAWAQSGRSSEAGDTDLMSILLGLMRLGIIVAILTVGWYSLSPPKGLICRGCGSQNVRRYVRGSFLIEVILWLCIIVPGLIYSIWRRTGLKKYRCKECGSLDIIPAKSPQGIKLQQEISGSP